ncbi:MAG TPA: hypothetical protein VFI54_13940 [Solirubrobacteraceae bacterium]|nr:hypothetical protein [Solirubrobacteraceae bacterium]
MATAANLTGALSRDTPEPDLSLPVSVPCATTPLAVARNLVIFAVIDSIDDVPPLVGGLEFALADGTTTAAKASTGNTPATSLRIVSSFVDENDPPPAPVFYPSHRL